MARKRRNPMGKAQSKPSRGGTPPAPIASRSEARTSPVHFKSPSGLSAAALAGLSASIAPGVIRAVLDSGKRLEPALAETLEGRRELKRGDRQLVTRSLSSLLRWWGWIEPLRLVRIEDQLLLAGLLDSGEVHEIFRAWARKAGRDPFRLFTSGDAPNWTARAEGLKRWAEGRAVTADPWLLFPGWLRDQLPVPPGEGTAKARRLALLFALQTRSPLWIGVRGGDERSIWNEFREAGIKPWVHRRLQTAAKLDPDTDLRPFRAYTHGELAIEDLSSQALGKICDPDPGERWWDVFGGAGLHALHLAEIMDGKGTVIITFDQEKRRHETALRLRRGKFRNIAAKVWDGKHIPARPGSFDGVLVDAPCSGVGNWRRHPEVRWTVARGRLRELALHQKRLLETACPAVRPGGTLVYTVATLTLCETTEVVAAFLAVHPEFRLDPFPHPLEDSATPGTLQLWPHLLDSEARFVARFIACGERGPITAKT
jgi:16S rRNA (cytosine967-C5)-methyltransferase